ncbi:MAG: glycosyltransferase family 4 protein [Polyangiaceae bacterium]|nr:glycosyltransferase family 4 protein [Polyangiaceae bacterium]
MPADVLIDLTPLDTLSRFRGIGRYTRSVARAIAALSPLERGGLACEGLVGLAGPQPVGPLDWDGSPGEPGPTIPWLMRRRSALVATLRRLRPRLFHATQPLGTPRGSFVPRVVTCHDLLLHALHEDYLPGRWLYRRGLWAADWSRYHSARRVIAVSRATADQLVSILGFDARRIDVVHHGVDHERFRLARDDAERAARAAMRQALGLDKPYFAYLGGTDPRKSIGVLCASFDAADLEDVELAVVGRTSEQERTVVDGIVAGLRHPERVRLLGYVADEAIPALLEGALGFVFPSIGEGFGLPVLEAMACGTPVVTPLGTSLVEVAGRAALEVPPRDVAALTSALARLHREPALRADLARAGLAHARGFTWRACALGTVESYRRALG